MLEGEEGGLGSQRDPTDWPYYLGASESSYWAPIRPESGGPQGRGSTTSCPLDPSTLSLAQCATPLRHLLPPPPPP